MLARRRDAPVEGVTSVTDSPLDRPTLDQVPFLAWTSGPDGARDWFNLKWLAFTGRHMGDEAEAGWSAGVHPDDRDQCLTTVEAAIAQREEFQVEYRLLDAGATYRWVLDRGGPRFGPDGGFLGFLGSV